MSAPLATLPEEAISGAVLTHRLDGSEGTPPVLLLNGGFMTAVSWGPLATALAEGHRVLRCDFRGQLLTPGPAHRELAPNVDDVVALLDHVGLERVHVVGTSFGGEVGLLLAGRHPDRVRSLVAVTVGDRATAEMVERTRRLREVVNDILAGGDRGRFYDTLVPDIFSTAYVRENGGLIATRRRQLAAFPDAWFREHDGILAAVEEFDVRPALPAIRCPTLVVVAADDRVIPTERGRAVHAAIPGAELALHPSSGHTLVLEDPDWLLEVTLPFLDSA